MLILNFVTTSLQNQLSSAPFLITQLNVMSAKDVKSQDSRFLLPTKLSRTTAPPAPRSNDDKSLSTDGPTANVSKTSPPLSLDLPASIKLVQQQLAALYSGGGRPELNHVYRGVDSDPVLASTGAVYAINLVGPGTGYNERTGTCVRFKRAVIRCKFFVIPDLAAPSTGKTYRPPRLVVFLDKLGTSATGLTAPTLTGANTNPPAAEGAVFTLVGNGQGSATVAPRNPIDELRFSVLYDHTLSYVPVFAGQNTAAGTSSGVTYQAGGIHHHIDLDLHFESQYTQAGTAPITNELYFAFVNDDGSASSDDHYISWTSDVSYVDSNG